MKRSLPVGATAAESSNKKWAVTYGTFQKWQCDFDKDLNTISSCDLVESEEESDLDSPTTTCTLDDWDNWMNENENSSLESDYDSD